MTRKGGSNSALFFVAEGEKNGRIGHRLFGSTYSRRVFGFVTQHIATSKVYETGFAWGFWLGVIGVIVVAVKPEVNASVCDYGGRSQYWKRLAGELPEQEPWRCVWSRECHWFALLYQVQTHEGRRRKQGFFEGGMLVLRSDE